MFMKTHLNEILHHKKQEVARLKQHFSYRDFESMEYFSRSTESIKDRLQNNFGIIAELKRASPSAGKIVPNLDVEQQGKYYASAGVAAISCLTDAHFFGGSSDDLLLLRKSVSIPILRKEFIIDELQLFESKAIGADAVLLIAEALEKEQALHFTIIAQRLGLEVIMECHDSKELQKINEFVDIIGINNRNLQLQKTSLETSFDLIQQIPDGRICISESGIKTKEEIEKLKSIGFHGALIGESILRQSEPALFIRSLNSLLSC